MKKTIAIALIALGLASCGTPNYLPCPAYSSLEIQEDNYLALNCENCDEID